MTILHFFGHWTGISDEAGAGYGFWSGIGGDLPLFGGVVMLWWHHTCHVKKCLRPGRHPHGPFKLCRKHHPLVPDEGPTAEHVKETPCPSA